MNSTTREGCQKRATEAERDFASSPLGVNTYHGIMRRLRLLVLVAVLALAGCSTATTATGGPDTPTLTPAPVPEDAPGARSDDYPPGVTADGVARPLRLVTRHAAVLRNASYTVRTERTVSYGNGTLRRRSTMTAAFAAGKTRYYQVFERAGPTVDHWERYADGERLFEAIMWNETTKYYVPRERVRARAYPDRLVGDPVRQDELYVVLTALNTTVEPVVRSGNRRYRVTATGLHDPEFLAAWTYVDAIETVSLTLLVTPEGVVERYRFAYTTTEGSRRVRVTETVRYSEIGTTTVRPPAWYDAAVANVTASD